jgi:predicted enzyme related to lactoylglutathione lyase
MEAKPGTIAWFDLTTDRADELRDFYADVAGWGTQGIDMGGYEDYVMTNGEDGVAGICHKRGCNEGQPGGWMLYINVADLDASLAKAVGRGGKQIGETRDVGGRMAIVEDPSGALFALYQA